MTPEQFAEILKIGHETRGIEFKGPFPRDDADRFYEVVRAILGMANLRDGGKVIIGVDEKKSADGSSVEAVPVGMSLDDLKGWDHEAVLSIVNSYADPFVDLRVQLLPYEGKRFVIVHVDEFPEFPVLCKKTSAKQKGGKTDVVLRDGNCYVRRRGKVETSENPKHVEMRDLLELATDKSLRRFLERMHRAGLSPHAEARPDDERRFEQQRGDFR
jgi:predicted HTH transcriptional regulator